MRRSRGRTTRTGASALVAARCILFAVALVGLSACGITSPGPVNVKRCSAPNSDCSERCVDTSSDIRNCGACGTTCAAGEVCSLGHCAIECAGGTTLCGSLCTNFDFDPQNCGACGATCAAGEVCSLGNCAIECVGGTTLCGSLCTNLDFDPENCGACGTTCTSAANTVGTCIGARCELGCLGTFADCDGQAANGCEMDTTSDVDHCGSCGIVCPGVPNGVRACIAGNCAIGSCTPAFADCNDILVDGCEANTSSDVDTCGACAPCPGLTHASGACRNGLCVIGSCEAGHEDCNGLVGDGCEVDIASDSLNCGSCGNVCTGSTCFEGGCVKQVFVTSDVYNGNLGGLAGADALCKGLADTAGLTGLFKAWLSGGGAAATDRLTHSTAPYVLVNGPIVAMSWTDLTDGSLLHSIDTTETGTVLTTGYICGVWTATKPDGTGGSTDDCNGWTSSTAQSLDMRRGSYLNQGTVWTAGCSGGNCGEQARLYCFEQ